MPRVKRSTPIQSGTKAAAERCPSPWARLRSARLGAAAAFCGGLQALADFLVADACYFCGKNYPAGGANVSHPDPPAGCLSETTLVYLFRTFPIKNRPICPDCARRFGPAPGTGRIGWYDSSGRVTTPSGDSFGGTPRTAGPSVRRNPLPVVAPFRINDMSLQLIHLIKFSGRRSLIQPVARAVTAALIHQGRPAGTDEVLVPVPMDRASLRRRGFNQAEMLSYDVSRQAGLPVAPFALKKIRPTVPQSLTGKAGRAANVRGVFRAGGRSIRDRDVLLVDDLVTTGATAASCASALVGAGARSVTVLCLASAL